MKIIPAIDLIKGKTVRLEQGEYDRELSYDISPVEAARKWMDMGAELIHVVDLDGAKEGFPFNLPVIKEIVSSVAVPVEVGGGFRTIADIEQALDLGVMRVVVGSRAFEDKDFAKECIADFGDKVIFSVDVKGLKPSIRGWKETVDMDVCVMLEEFRFSGANEIIYTDIASDGMLSGPNIEELERVLDAVDIKIISAGGVKTVEDIRQLKNLEPKGLTGAIIGRALYEGTIDLKEAIDAGKEDNTLS
ncbi:MAG: 1-(5-phosphoribosyl)-5-[(5-phosphoribosylamino)methylideneamino]imidazole-4-carboxamide isomerase [Candidatus Omnitrophica bacterium]|nr:1-(5-phosphoribosyl)-5-[(5-phosphoribosylamino)methylideneamino]imidazole-4-carboxamide isomerase [Candidatus Omnitrophota bacterium]